MSTNQHIYTLYIMQKNELTGAGLEPMTLCVLDYALPTELQRHFSSLNPNHAYMYKSRQSKACT